MNSEFFIQNIKNDMKIMDNSFVLSWDSQLTPEAAGCPIWSSRHLVPPEGISNDYDYTNYLYFNDKAMELIAIIGYMIKTNNIVIILSNGNYAEDFLYMFLKFIQNRYGIVYRDVKCLEDIPEVPGDTDSFSIQGLYNFNAYDNNRVVRYIESLKISDPDFRMFFEQNLNEKAAEL